MRITLDLEIADRIIEYGQLDRIDKLIKSGSPAQLSILERLAELDFVITQMVLQGNMFIGNPEAIEIKATEVKKCTT